MLLAATVIAQTADDLFRDPEAAAATARAFAESRRCHGAGLRGEPPRTRRPSEPRRRPARSV
jgi:hypothetical protein